MTPEDKTAALLAALWHKNRPLMLERLASLETLLATDLTPESRAEAIGLAHKFAGSLGMFGCNEGTRLAREIEVLLERDEPVDRTVVAPLLMALRKTLCQDG